MMTTPVRFIDLFCGVGGFRYAAMQALEARGLLGECVFSSDIDKDCQAVYAQNFGEFPAGDITAVPPESLPDFDLLLGGFPCQPFSIIGKGKGFEDTRGTLFFSIARILEAKRPRAFVLENVKQLRGHNGGKTLERIMVVLRELGYFSAWHVYNAMDFGLPQNRERIFIVGFREPANFRWPRGGIPMTPLSGLLEKDVSEFYTASAHIQAKRARQVDVSRAELPCPGIWHENKSSHVSVYPFSCALRAGSSYNYLLVDGKRRLTGREMFRLQGFPETFKLAGSYTVARHQAGNSLPVPVARAIIGNVLKAIAQSDTDYPVLTDSEGQVCFLMESEVE